MTNPDRSEFGFVPQEEITKLSHAGDLAPADGRELPPEHAVNIRTTAGEKVAAPDDISQLTEPAETVLDTDPQDDKPTITLLPTDGSKTTNTLIDRLKSRWTEAPLWQKVAAPIAIGAAVLGVMAANQSGDEKKPVRPAAQTSAPFNPYASASPTEQATTTSPSAVPSSEQVPKTPEFNPKMAANPFTLSRFFMEKLQFADIVSSDNDVQPTPAQLQQNANELWQYFTPGLQAHFNGDVNVWEREFASASNRFQSGHSPIAENESKVEADAQTHTDTGTFFDVQGLGQWDNSTGTYAPQEYRVAIDLGWDALHKHWAISNYAYTTQWPK